MFVTQVQRCPVLIASADAAAAGGRRLLWRRDGGGAGLRTAHAQPCNPKDVPPLQPRKAVEPRGAVGGP